MRLHFRGRWGWGRLLALFAVGLNSARDRASVSPSVKGNE